MKEPMRKTDIDPNLLTIRHAQRHQPWTQPYSDNFEAAASGTDDSEGHGIPELLPHLYGSHTVLHAMKSLGKIATVYEWRDHHTDDPEDPRNWNGLRIEHQHNVRDCAADLVTAALRLANLEGFDLAEALIERSREKNGTGYPGNPDAEPLESLNKAATYLRLAQDGR